MLAAEGALSSPPMLASHAFLITPPLGRLPASLPTPFGRLHACLFTPSVVSVICSPPLPRCPILLVAFSRCPTVCVCRHHWGANGPSGRSRSALATQIPLFLTRDLGWSNVRQKRSCVCVHWTCMRTGSTFIGAGGSFFLLKYSSGVSWQA